MSNDQAPDLQEELYALKKRCAYLERKLTRVISQQQRQETIDDIYRHMLQRTNDKLHKYHEKAQQESISKSDFLANMSHEIRTPLNIILGMANLLADTNLDKAQTQYLNSLRVTGRQLMEILNNVLEFSRIDAGKVSFEPEPFSLERILNHLEASIMPLCVQKELKYRVVCSPQIVMERIGDPLKIYQVLLNLINNAVKFTPAGGKITLAVEEVPASNAVLHLSVKDTGIGISEENQTTIFQRFSQVHDLFSRSQSGTGLGLAICQKLSHAMGGEIGVDSQLGRGTKFTCVLPLPLVPENERNIIRLEAHHILPENFPQLHILAVDDIRENIEVLKVYLRDYPISIHAAIDGQEALDLLENNQYDLILMDIRMPMMDGVTATKVIREREKLGVITPQIILALTAHAFQEQKKKIIESGFDGVLSKPFFRKELIQTIYTFAVKSKYPTPLGQLGNKAIGYYLEQNKPEEIPDALRPLLPTLVQTIKEDLFEMKSSMERTDYQYLYSKAHALKGVAGMFGFQELSSLIFDLSQTVKAGNIVVANELLVSLDFYINRLQELQRGKI